MGTNTNAKGDRSTLLIRLDWILTGNPGNLYNFVHYIIACVYIEILTYYRVIENAKFIIKL